MNALSPTAIGGTIEDAQTGPRPHQHMPALDGLRGVAILLVLIDHLSASVRDEFYVSHKILYWAELGWSGVDLFFVLSGFLITGILYDAKGTPCYFKNFYARRSLRIFPLYYAALALVMLMNPLLEYLKLTGTANPGWMVIYATNFIISIDGERSFGVLDHFWSLAVEEHFYLIWPAIVFFLDRRKLMMVAAGACLLAPLLRLATADGDSLLPIAAYMATPMRMDSLAAGAFIALLVRRPKGMEGIVRPAMIVAGTALTLVLSIVLLRHTKDPQDIVMGTIGFSILWMFYGSVLLLALNWQPLRTLMQARFLRWFGKYSYGMYVWHPIIFILVFHNDLATQVRGGDTPLHALVSSVIALAAMFAVTLASWHLWEKQFLKFKSRFA
jgi:peptidoglycan/LPS O-acetylase OafA/YrhL